MKEHIFIANTYKQAKFILEEYIGKFCVKDLVTIQKHPHSYTFSGDNRYSCASINSTDSLRGKKFETIYLPGNISDKFMKEILPHLHFEKIYYWYEETIKDV